MKILLRKIAGEGRALIRTDRRVLVSGGTHPSLLATVGSFVLAILFPLCALALTALAMHFGGDAGVLMAAAPIVELRAKKSTFVKEANTRLEAIQAKCSTEGRVMTVEEKASLDADDQKLAAFDEQIELEQKRLDRAKAIVPTKESRATPTVESQRNRADDDTARGFRSGQDFCLAVMQEAGVQSTEDITDERLKPLAIRDDEKSVKRDGLAFVLPGAFSPKAAAGSDEAGVYDDRYGGFFVTSSRAPGILEVGFEGDPTEGRTQAVPMSTPSVEIMAATDKDHTSSVSGGITFSRRAETTSTSGQRREYEMITLKAASLWGIGYATEEILRDSPVSFAALIASGFARQRSAHMLNEKIRGTGGNEYLGVLNSPAKVSVPKESGQAADTIVANNVIKMAARSWGFGNAVWLANHDTRPQLAVLHVPVGVAGVLLYQPSQQPGFPDMLWGRPVFYTEYASTIGDEGDLMLVNWSQYLEGVYQALETGESVHVRFINGERTFRFWERNAGAPWWRSALTPAKSSTTLSPIVTLAARA